MVVTQKGTCGLIMKQADLMFSPEGITPDIVVNPNAIPSRMTIGQLIECLLGKVVALRGIEGDGTPFNTMDIEPIKDQLEKFGYRRDGTEYLYNGMTGQRMRVAIFIGPTYYQRLKHLVMDKIHCLSMDHEVLTENGWKFHNQLTLDDKVATLKDGKLVYEKPIKILHYPDYEGDMYNIKTQMIDLNVTTNHRMWISKKFGRDQKWLPHDFALVSDIIGKQVRYKKDAIWDVPDYQFVLPSITDGNNVFHPEKTFDMNAWITFFGIWIAEGWTTTAKDKRYPNSQSYRVDICQCKERVRNVIYDSITKLGYHYGLPSEDKITITDKQLYTYMQPLSVGAPQKRLPDWVWKLSAKQAQLLLHSMILGDGSINNKVNGTQSCYYTSSVGLAGDVMKLCLHIGWSATKTLHHDVGNKTTYLGRDIIARHKLWRLGINKSKNMPTVNHGHVGTQDAQTEVVTHQKCPVFCLEVPSGVFYVRRDGKSVWTGNSRSRGPRTMLTHQPLEGRSREGGLRFGEMERDSCISYGISLFLKERLVYTSDAYSTNICEICGLFAHRILKKESKPYASKNDIYGCPGCNNKTKIARVVMPYAFKLMIQELASMNICARIRIKQ